MQISKGYYKKDIKIKPTKIGAFLAAIIGWFYVSINRQRISVSFRLSFLIISRDVQDDMPPSFLKDLKALCWLMATVATPR